MRTIIMSSLAALLFTGCTSNQYDTALDYDLVREITESSEYFYYTSNVYSFEDSSYASTAKSSDGYVEVTTNDEHHVISIDTHGLKTSLFQQDIERRLLEQGIRLVTAAGQELDFEKINRHLVINVPFGELSSDYIVLLSGDDYQGAVYLPLPSKTCLEYTDRVPESCSFTTDECGFIYANILDAGKVLTSDFEYPHQSLACNVEPSDMELFNDNTLYFPSDDLDCEGMTKIECIFYQR